MRYVIGIRIPDKDGNLCDGLYVYTKSGLPFAMSKEYAEKLKELKKEEDLRIEVFNSIEEINDRLNSLRKTYRKEFLKRVNSLNCNIKDFRFYPVKLDSANLTYIKILHKVYTKDNKKNIFAFSYN